MPSTAFPSLMHAGFHHKKLHTACSNVSSMKLEEEVTLGVKNCSQACGLFNQNTQRVVQSQNPLYQASASWLSDLRSGFEQDGSGCQS